MRAQSEGEQAKAAYQKGQTEYNLGNYDEAQKHFQEAYRLKPVPALLFNIGQCYRATGELQRAASAYKSFLRTAPAGDRNSARVKELLAEVEEAIAKGDNAKLAPPQGLAHEQPEGPPSAAPKLLPPPAAAAPLVKGAPPPLPASAPAAKKEPAPPGKVAAPPAALTSAPAPAPERKRVYTWVAAGGAAVALAGGAFFGLKSKSGASDLASSQHLAADIASRSDEVKSNASKANLLFAASGVLAVAAGAMFVLRF